MAFVESKNRATSSEETRREVLAKWNSGRQVAASDLESATADEIFDLIDNEFGKS